MKKIAIIIKSEANDLPGVAHDERNFCNFLKSHYGGAWQDCEFHTVSTPPLLRSSIAYLCAELSIIQNRHYEYAIVLYSGHGSLNEEEQLIIYPDNGLAVEAKILCNLAPKQLTIFDCCRALEKEPEMIKEAADAAQCYNPIARSRYENLVKKALPQQNFLFACGIDECAQDTSKGALYLNELFKAGKIFTGPMRWKTVREAHELAAKYVSLKSLGQQHPDCLIPKMPREFSLPFSINPWV